MNIVEIDPKLCRKWEFVDRSGFEYGDIALLAEDIRLNGQIEPVFARPISDPDFKYEIIAGNRRHSACTQINLPLKAFVKDVDDFTAALIQHKENDKVPLSDFSKGMIIAKYKKQKSFTQAQLAKLYGYSKRKIENLLYFSKVDYDIWDAVSNMSKVSARSAATIHHICNKSKAHKNAIFEIIDEIKKGAGHQRITKLVEQVMHGTDEDNAIDKRAVRGKSGELIATWHGNKLQFNKNLNFDIIKLEQTIIEFFTPNQRGHLK